MPDGDDWDRVVYAPLIALDPKLATRLHARFVERFATRARLSDRQREDAAEQLALDRGVAPGGTVVLRAGLPLGCGESFHEWDGSPAGAEEIVDSMAETAGADLFDDLVGDGFDTLTLSVEQGGTTWPDQVVFTINGRDLRHLARATGLVDVGMTGPPRSVLAEHPDHLLGGPDRWEDADDPYYDDPALLGCGCGQAGCAALLVHIEVGDHDVVWSDFRRDRDHGRPDIGPFRFHRRPYLAQLDRLRDLP